MSGKSKEEIAFDLVSKLKGVGVWGEQNKEDILNMYAECLEATSGLRNLEGRKQPSALRLAAGASSATATKAPAPRQAAPQPPQQAAPVQQPQHAPAQQPQVRQQQQMLQQAYQQQQVPQAR